MSHAIVHLSEQPWSNYTAADYSIEQWHAACLIHQHEGSPTSKSQCKLPVKTPSGAVNKNGVHAAAAALAGARGGVHASPEAKASAARALRGYYSKMNEQPPPSLMKHYNTSNVIDFIDHHGVKGMKWGVRNKRSVRPSAEGRRTAELRKKKPIELTNRQLKTVAERQNLESTFRRMNPGKIAIGKAKVAAILGTVGLLTSAYATFNSPAGKAAIAQGKKFMTSAKAAKIARTIAKANKASGQLTLF